MIYGITGNTGGGKSYRAVQLMLEALAKGRDVVTNIPLLFEHPQLHQWDWEILTKKQKTSFLESLERPPETVEDDIPFPKGSLYVLDECWRGFQSGTSLKNLGERTLAFFKEHRHRVNSDGLTDDIFLVTQDLADIPKPIRVLCKQTILCVKPDDIGLDNLSVRYYMTGSVMGLEPVHRHVIKTEREQLKPDVYSKYKSHTKGNAGESLIQEGTAIKSTFWQSGKFKLMLFGVVSSMVLMGISGNHILTETLPKYQNVEGNIGSRDKTQSVVNQSSPAVSAPVSLVKPDKPLTPIESVRWRIVGIVKSKKNGDEFVYIEDVSRRIRRIDRHSCRDELHQLICTIDGEIITAWSGPNSGTSVSSGMTKAARSFH